MDFQEPEYQRTGRLFEVDFERPRETCDMTIHVRKVIADTHHLARMEVIENNRVGRIIRSVNRGPA